MSGDVDFSLVIPAYNECKRILPSLQRATDYLTARGEAYEITVVDDGSTDDTRALCLDFAASHPGIAVVGYPTNRGKGYAVKAGVLVSRGRVVAFSDADMPVPPEEYGRFLAALRRGHELAIGSRYLPSADWKMSVGRRITGWGFRVLVRALAGTRVTDTQFGFKAFTAQVAKDLFSSLVTEGFAFDAEIIRLAQCQGYRIAELPVRGANAPGSRVEPFRHALQMLRELVAIRFSRGSRWRAKVEAESYAGMPRLRL